MERAYYAAYKGDTFVDLGTRLELSARLHIKPKTLTWYACSKRYNRFIADKPNLFRVIRIED